MTLLQLASDIELSQNDKNGELYLKQFSVERAYAKQTETELKEGRNYVIEFSIQNNIAKMLTAIALERFMANKFTDVIHTIDIVKYTSVDPTTGRASLLIQFSSTKLSSCPNSRELGKTAEDQSHNSQ